MYSILAVVPSVKSAHRVRDLIGQAYPPHPSLLTTVSGTVELYILLYNSSVYNYCCFCVDFFFFLKKLFFPFCVCVCINVCVSVYVCVCAMCSRFSAAVDTREEN